jgi:hypothetical protein
MIYDVTTLSLLPNTLGQIMPRLAEVYASFSGTGRTLGCFACEFGVLNRFAFLTAYDDEDALAAEKARLLRAEDPWGLRAILGGVDSVAYRPLSFARPIEPGSHGPFYEFRTYTVAPGGLPETEAAWAKIIERRETMSPLLTNMGSIGPTAPQRMLHIWPYASISDRMAARAQASREGIWPPPGGSGHLTSLQSELFVAAACSDLK